VTWQDRAAKLAARILYPHSRWWNAVTTTPRHLLIPRWFDWDEEAEGWQLRDGPSDERAWMAAVYTGQTRVTRVGAVHADHAEPGRTYPGWPTSSSTAPGLVVAMYRHAHIYDGADVLDVGTGTGYGCALLTRRLGAGHVTSIDVDPYLTRIAAERLDTIGIHPAILTADATAELPGSYDRIVPMMSAPRIPASWLTALRPGGRLVFSLAGTSALITANKTPDGGAAGQVEWYPASFMTARHGTDCPSPLDGMFKEIRDAEGEHVSQGKYPVLNVTWGWELDVVLGVTVPGVVHRYKHDEKTGTETAWMLHEDGSWARASGTENEAPIVHQSGPRRLWDTLDDIRHHWVANGALPVRGADVEVDPDGTCHLSKGKWNATIR
jgi:protein-L-isoaspartate O-methyltransferase